MILMKVVNFSFTRNSPVFATSDVYWAYALETYESFPRSSGGGDYITSWGSCCPLLTPTPKGGCMVPLEPLVEGSDSLLPPGCVVGLV